jgi:hypothetical protein
MKAPKNIYCSKLGSFYSNAFQMVHDIAEALNIIFWVELYVLLV